MGLLLGVEQAKSQCSRDSLRATKGRIAGGDGPQEVEGVWAWEKKGPHVHGNLGKEVHRHSTAHTVKEMAFSWGQHGVAGQGCMGGEASEEKEGREGRESSRGQRIRETTATHWSEQVRWSYRST